MAALIVRRFGTNEEVDRVELQSVSERRVDRVIRGMMINMDLNRFWVDDSEVKTERAAQNDQS